MEWLIKPKKVLLVKPQKKEKESDEKSGSQNDVYGYETLCALNCPSFCGCDVLVR